MYRLIRSQRRWPAHTERFQTLFEQYKDSQCEDVRDRVFALLRIAEEVALKRGFSVDYEKNVEETFITLVSWGGTGAIQINSLLEFAMLAAKVMRLEWPLYALEPNIEVESERSSCFANWRRQSISTPLPCQYLGKWKIDEEVTDDRRGTIDPSKPSLKLPEPWRHSLKPTHALLPHAAHRDFDMFGFGNSGILLACTSTAHSTWTVSARAYFQYCGEAPHARFRERPFVRSVFEDLQISLSSTKQHVIRLNNVAQFMEI
jgi:hypothetical protein